MHNVPDFLHLHPKLKGDYVRPVPEFAPDDRCYRLFDNPDVPKFLDQTTAFHVGNPAVPRSMLPEQYSNLLVDRPVLE